MIKKPKFIYNDLYYTNIWYYDSHTQEQFLADVKKRLQFSLSQNDATARTIELTDTDHTVIVVWIDKKSNIKNRLMYLSHEAVHITNLILARAGVIPNFNNDEAQAYLHAWVFSKLIKDIKIK